jgi:hypothetical protein
MTLRRRLSCLIALCLFCPSAFAQEASKALSSQEIDLSAMLKETQQSANESGYVGLIWWIPTEYWEISLVKGGFSEDKAKERYAPLKKYTVVAAALGKMGIGNVNWVPETDIRDNLRLRDSEGNTYPSVQKLSGDAEGLASVLKPVFSNILGPMGQNIVLLFFPAVNKMARPIADPLAAGSFSLVLSKLMNGKDKAFEWKLPLSSLSPPKYCPVGKERLQANWKYCPWHGVKLDDEMSPAGSAK